MTPPVEKSSSADGDSAEADASGSAEADASGDEIDALENEESPEEQCPLGGRAPTTSEHARTFPIDYSFAPIRGMSFTSVFQAWPKTANVVWTTPAGYRDETQKLYLDYVMLRGADMSAMYSCPLGGKRSKEDLLGDFGDTRLSSGKYGAGGKEGGVSGKTYRQAYAMTLYRAWVKTGITEISPSLHEFRKFCICMDGCEDENEHRRKRNQRASWGGYSQK